MTFEYGKDADTLYVTLREPHGKKIIVENANGDLIWVDEVNGQIVGCTVLAFMYRARFGHEIVIPEIGMLPLDQIASHLLRDPKREH